MPQVFAQSLINLVKQGQSSFAVAELLAACLACEAVRPEAVADTDLLKTKLRLLSEEYHDLSGRIQQDDSQSVNNEDFRKALDKQLLALLDSFSAYPVFYDFLMAYPDPSSWKVIAHRLPSEQGSLELLAEGDELKQKMKVAFREAEQIARLFDPDYQEISRGSLAAQPIARAEGANLSWMTWMLVLTTLMVVVVLLWSMVLSNQ